MSAEACSMDFPRLIRLLPIPRAEYRDVLVCLAVILLAYQITGIFYKVLATGMIGNVGTHNSAVAAPSHSALTNEPEDFYRVIGDRNLFGSTDTSLPENQAPAAQAAPLATLLQVLGTVAGEDGFGFAVIEERGKGKQNLYRIGETVAGATVVQIMRDRVVLRIAGRDETVMKAEAPVASILNSISAGAGQAATAVPPGVMATISPEGVAIPVNRRKIASTLKSLRLKFNPAQIRQSYIEGTLDSFVQQQAGRTP